MSGAARRRVGRFGLMAALALGAPAGLFAQATVTVRVAGDLSGRTGDAIDVPIQVDLTNAPGRRLGGYRARA